MTGLEPITTYCQLYPSARCDPTRPGIEGFSILRKVPHFPADREFPSALFAEDAVEGISQTLAEIRRRFSPSNHFEIRKAWEDWVDLYCPQSNDASQYVQLMAERNLPIYRFPLKGILTNKDKVVVRVDGEIQSQNSGSVFRSVLESNPSTIVWPEILAAAMNSVASENNPHPPRPRLTMHSHQALIIHINEFKATTDQYYSNALKPLTNAVLEKRLRMRVGYTGLEPSTSRKSNSDAFFFFLVM